MCINPSLIYLIRDYYSREVLYKELINLNYEVRDNIPFVFVSDFDVPYRKYSSGLVCSLLPPKKSFVDSSLEYFKISCGKCIWCLIRRSAHWAVRCQYEILMHKHSCFLTLTYDEDHLPKDRQLSLSHIQLFLKRLRRFLQYRGYGKIRFFGCGEYGSRNYRPHYHLMIFGYDFGIDDPDRLPFTKNFKGHSYYLDKTVNDLWPYGLHVLGKANYATARYVASYIFGKLKNKKEKRKFLVPEYVHSSRKPGIGIPFLEEHWSDIYPLDAVVFSTDDKTVKKLPPPRAFDKWLSVNKPELFKKVIRNRIEKFESLEDFTYDYKDFFKCRNREINLSSLLSSCSRL